MVYINLSVNSAESAVEFYCNRLGLFDYKAGRLVCNAGVDLILDLEQCGTDRHFDCFGQHEHAPSSFWVHIGGDSQEPVIEILEDLNRKGVEFEDVGYLGGHYLKFLDPSGNKFTLHAHLGAIS